MIPDIYHYATIPLDLVEPCFRVPMPTDAFLSKDETSTALAELLNAGYRWVRTDGDVCVFEKLRREGVPANKL
jgi:hypothetical protein